MWALWPNSKHSKCVLTCAPPDNNKSEIAQNCSRVITGSQLNALLCQIFLEFCYGPIVRWRASRKQPPTCNREGSINTIIQQYLSQEIIETDKIEQNTDSKKEVSGFSHKEWVISNSYTSLKIVLTTISQGHF